jgi:hypothetical protein
VSPVGDLVVTVGIIVAAVVLNVAVWRLWGQAKAADLRIARKQWDFWSDQARTWERRAEDLAEENARLASDAHDNARRETVARLHERMGDGS